MKAECQSGEDAHAFLTGELSRSEETRFEQHLSGCAQCRGAVASARRVIGLLRSAPEVEVERDLAPLVLAALRDEPRALGQPVRWPRIAAIAAALTLFAGGVATLLEDDKPARVATDERAASVDRALDWFCQSQEADGSWDAEKWGGQRRFAVALTALPALALLSADALTPQRAAAADRAAEWLRTQQVAGGRFGPDFQGAPYNQSLATLALLHAHRRQPDAALARTLDTAIAAILARQTGEGGWGYAHSPLADRSITEWHVEVLALASVLGWEQMRPNLERGRAWLAAHRDPRADAAEPPDSPSALLARSADPAATGADALDFYRAYFLTAALRREPGADSRERLAAIRKTVLRRQAPSGAESGSWPPDDRWGRAGGRLYSTALASLALQHR